MSIKRESELRRERKREKNHSTQDSRVVPHRGTNWAAPWLTSQIGRDAVLSRSYGRGYLDFSSTVYIPYFLDPELVFQSTRRTKYPTLFHYVNSHTGTPGYDDNSGYWRMVTLPLCDMCTG